jgi:hypothetical protein
MNRMTGFAVTAILALGAIGGDTRAAGLPQTAPVPAPVLQVTYYFLPG